IDMKHSLKISCIKNIITKLYKNAYKTTSLFVIIDVNFRKEL
ncbi:hypothetical protein HMPREF9383_1424, partial [Streptococcus sanguinis SK150]